MLHFRIFFLVFFLLFGITAYITLPLIAERPNWWIAPFVFSSIASLSCLNALIGTFFGMSRTDTGNICMQKNHPLYRWLNGCFNVLFEVAKSFGPKYMENAHWSGTVSGCNLFWLLMPLVVLESVVICVATVFGLFLYTYFTGSFNLNELDFMPLVYIGAFMAPPIIAGLTAIKYPRFSLFLYCVFGVSICSVLLYAVITEIMKNGFLTVLMGLGEVALIGISVIAALAAAIWLTSYIYHIIPVLRNSALGQLIANAKKGICPIAMPCPVNEESV